MATIDKVCKEEANSFILFDPDIVKGLYQRGLIYFDVPVHSDDRFKGNYYWTFIIVMSELLQLPTAYPWKRSCAYFSFFGESFVLSYFIDY